jgi:hypothetical protein
MTRKASEGDLWRGRMMNYQSIPFRLDSCIALFMKYYTGLRQDQDSLRVGEQAWCLLAGESVELTR